jgi:hypothetical protein
VPFTKLAQIQKQNRNVQKEAQTEQNKTTAHVTTTTTTAPTKNV